MNYDIRKKTGFLFLMLVAAPFVIIALGLFYLILMAVSFAAFLYSIPEGGSFLWVVLLASVCMLPIAFLLSIFAKKIWGADQPVRLETNEKSLKIIYQGKPSREIPWGDFSRFRVTANPRMLFVLGSWQRPSPPWLFITPYFRIGSGILLELILKDNSLISIDVYDTIENAAYIGKDIESRI
jgi:hypothetical protein